MVLADEAIRPGSADLDLAVLSQKILCWRSEIYDAIARSATGPLAARLVASIDEHLEFRAEKLLIFCDLNFALMLLKNSKPRAFHLFGNRIRHVFRRRIGPRRILESEYAIEFHFAKKRKSFSEFGVGLARKTNDDVRGDAR